jgi:hypothetical protein
MCVDMYMFYDRVHVRRRCDNETRWICWCETVRVGGVRICVSGCDV